MPPICEYWHVLGFVFGTVGVTLCFHCRYLGHRLKNFFFPENTAEDIAKEIVYAIRFEKDEIILPVIVIQPY